MTRNGGTASRRGVVFNGKFLSSRATGVYRVASELLRGIDESLARSASDGGGSWSLICPRNADGVLPLSRIRRLRVGSLTKQAWEQLEVPAYVGTDLLVGLCNMAPLILRGSITLIHDAHVFSAPGFGSPAFNAWYRLALPRIGDAAAAVVTVSNHSRDQLVRHGIAPASKIRVIANGGDHLTRVVADRRVLAKMGLTPETYILAVANSQSHKNVAVLFEAQPMLAELGVRLVVVGPDDRSLFERRGRPVPADVKFTGYVNDTELRALYEGAVCLAFPSTTEGFGLPPIEAMSLGCPVLAAPCGSLPEVCGAAAIFVDPRDPAAWVSAVGRLEDVSERARLVLAGKSQAARYRWQDSVLSWLALIEEVRAAPR